MSSGLVEFTEKEFSDFLKSGGRGVVLFGAPWCAACKIIEPFLKELVAEVKHLTLAEVDVGKTPGLASRMGVMSLPNILFIKNGKVVEQIIGTASKKEIEKKLKKLSTS